MFLINVFILVVVGGRDFYLFNMFDSLGFLCNCVLFVLS